jgi:hypothetical protein
MNDFDIPIFKNTYELYKTFYAWRNLVPKQDRYGVWQRCEDLVLDLLEALLKASQLPRPEKVPVLEKASFELNMLRVFVRLTKDIKAIDNKKYITLESSIDEIGRMLGGWIKSLR